MNSDSGRKDTTHVILICTDIPRLVCDLSEEICGGIKAVNTIKQALPTET
jgi:hypothetical protein